MSTALAIQQPQGITSLKDLQEISNVFVKSGFFADTKDAAQAMVKIMAGQEYGFPAFQSMTGIHIIKGKPSLSANLMAAAIKRSGRYSFRVAKGHPTETECSITFLELIGDKWEEIGTSTFTKQDATKAGTQNMDKFPRNMLYARALSNGVKWYCPDVFNSPVYVPEELGATVNGDGEVIDIQPEPTPAAPAFNREEVIAGIQFYFELDGRDGWAEYRAQHLDKASDAALTKALKAAHQKVQSKFWDELANIRHEMITQYGCTADEINEIIAGDTGGVFVIEQLDIEQLRTVRETLAAYLDKLKSKAAA